jgi:hypothetical protein
MNFTENILIGSGMSSFIYHKSSNKKLKIFTERNNQIIKSKNFYEYDAIGGNTNIWGGYINYKRHKNFLKHKKYKNFFKNNILKICKIFKNTSKFSNTYCVMSKDNEIFRIKKSFFKKNLVEEKIKKIIVKKKLIELVSNNKTYSTNRLTLCAGNLNLIKLLYQSNWILSKDVISFDDSECNYVFNIYINQKKNYYIPMPFKEIIGKFFFNKLRKYKLIKESLILQKFSNSKKKYNIMCGDLLKMNETKIRYFLSNHVANLRVNQVPIRKFIHKKSKKINVFCSGTVKKYLAGPIIQDIIFDILENK